MPVFGVPDYNYTTPLNTTLTVLAASGVLVNDYSTDGLTLTASLVSGSATGGTVTLNSDGSFTFVPTTAFIGVAQFLYRAVEAATGETSDETIVQITVGDPLVFAHLVSQSEGQAEIDGKKSSRTVWSCRADALNRTAPEICLSPKLPKRGDPLRRFTMAAGTYSIVNSYTQDGGDVDPFVVVVLVEARQEEGNPFLWKVTVSYEGVSDPTAEPPDVQSTFTEYQDYRTVDIYGRPITNSALDPIQGGMPVDGTIRTITITRNLPYDAWDMERGTQYENTLNILPYPLSGQFRNGSQVYYPSGTVRLKRISEQRLVRSRNMNASLAQFYWKVTAELAIDLRTYRPSAGAAEQYVCHRWIVADAGFNTLSASTAIKTPIMLFGQRPTEPQLLDGKGGLLANPSNTFPPLALPGTAGAFAVALPDTYATTTGATLTVSAANGVLKNDVCLLSGASLSATLVSGIPSGQGSVTLNTDGSFTYTPASGFVGYTYFTYNYTAGGLTSNTATVTIFVGAIPVMNAYERYEYDMWSPDLDNILFGW